MNDFRALLKYADPLDREAPRLDAERERIRLAILRTPPVEPSTSPIRARLALVAVLSLAALGIALLGYETWLHGTTPVLAAVRFEVRLAEDRPVPGLVVGQTTDPRRLIYLHPEIVVSNEDIALSRVVQDGPGTFAISVQFLQAGAERMKQATTSHVGRPMAILIDGTVVMAPVIRSPVSDSAMITGNFTQAEAERISAGIGMY